MNIDKILNDVRKRAKKIKCPQYLTKKILKDIDEGYKNYKKIKESEK